MNILVVSHYGIYSDFNTSFVHAQAAAYAALGHRVRVIVPIAVGKCDREGKRISKAVRTRLQDGVEVVDVRFLSLSGYGERHFNTASAIAALKCNWKAVLEDFYPNVIHAHTLGFDSEIGAWLKNKLQCPVIVTTHGSDTSVRVMQGKLEELKQYCDRVDAVIAVSSKLADKVRACGTKTMVSSILNGFRLHSLQENVEKKQLSFIQVGHLLPQKRFDVTIRAFADVQKEYPEATLKIIGTGAERENLEALVADLGICEKVQFLGQVPNVCVLEEMAKSQFFIMPSVNEGFGIVYLEAMASGCVTIGTCGEGIADLIVSGENGFLITPDQPKEIVDMVMWCKANPEKTQEMIRKGKRDAMQMTWARNARAYLELFERINT